MSDRDRLSLATDRAFAELEALGGDLSGLSEAARHLVLATSAQGVIDNGGYRSFFESDWPGTPDYSRFVEAYEAIGCHPQAEDLRRVVDTFGFPAPHEHADLRHAMIAEHYDPETNELAIWGDALCGDESVWEALRRYVEDHTDLLPGS